MTRLSGVIALAALGFATTSASGLVVDKRGRIAKRVTVLPASGSDSVHKFQDEALHRETASANDLSSTVDRLAASAQAAKAKEAEKAKETAMKAERLAAKQAAKAAAAASASGVVPMVKAEVAEAKPPTGVPNPGMNKKKKRDVVKTGGVVSSVSAETGSGSGSSLKNVFGAKAKTAAASASAATATDPESQKWDMIKEYRAEKCTEREDPLNHEDCMKFMTETCNPAGNDGPEGEAVQMNGEPGENGSGKGFCSAFYKNVEAQKQREAGGGKEEAKAEEPEAEPAPAAEEKEEEPKALSDAVADSKSSGSGPTGMDRRVLGKSRIHVDGTTQVGGWRNEYGNGVDDTFGTACAAHPNNRWCLERGYSFSIFHSPIWWLLMGIIIGVSGFTLFTVYKEKYGA